jgi:hypothetical protein
VGELKKVRVGAQAQERKLVVILRQLETLRYEKKEMEGLAAANNAKLKRTQVKLTLPSNVSAAEAAQQLSSKATAISGLKSEVGTLQDQAARDGNVICGLKEEVRLLTEGLQVRAEEMGIKGDMKEVLLFDVAHSRDEARSLAIESANKSGLLKKSEQNRKLLGERIEELRLVSEMQVEQILEMEKQVRQCVRHIMTSRHTALFPPMHIECFLSTCRSLTRRVT